MTHWDASPTPTSVEVELADGTTERADAVIVTAPIGALSNIKFDPPLPAGQQKVIAEGTNSVGFKIWIKVAGRHSIIAGAPGDNPISLLRSEYFLDDEDATILVGFGSDHNAIDLQDVDSAQKALNVWRDDRKVLDCGGHDWVADLGDVAVQTVLRRMEQLPVERLAAALCRRRLRPQVEWRGGGRGHRVRDCHRAVVDQGVCERARLKRQRMSGATVTPVFVDPARIVWLRRAGVQQHVASGR